MSENITFKEIIKNLSRTGLHAVLLVAMVQTTQEACLFLIEHTIMYDSSKCTYTKCKEEKLSVIKFCRLFWIANFHKNFLFPGLNSAEIRWLKTVHLYDLSYED